MKVTAEKRDPKHSIYIREQCLKENKKTIAYVFGFPCFQKRFCSFLPSRFKLKASSFRDFPHEMTFCCESCLGLFEWTWKQHFLNNLVYKPHINDTHKYSRFRTKVKGCNEFYHDLSAWKIKCFKAYTLPGFWQKLAFFNSESCFLPFSFHVHTQQARNDWKLIRMRRSQSCPACQRPCSGSAIVQTITNVHRCDAIRLNWNRERAIPELLIMHSTICMLTQNVI